MIDKLEFYHGAAIIRLIEDERCKTVAKHTHGYLVNQSKLVVVKYSTRNRPPWQFTFSNDDVERLQAMQDEFDTCLITLVCGGDGVCALSASGVERLLSSAPGALSIKRPFGGCYSISGPAGTHKGKIPMNQWPSIVFN